VVAFCVPNIPSLGGVNAMVSSFRRNDLAEVRGGRELQTDVPSPPVSNDRVRQDQRVRPALKDPLQWGRDLAAPRRRTDAQVACIRTLPEQSVITTLRSLGWLPEAGRKGERMSDTEQTPS
jgi:hypothetical protein